MAQKQTNERKQLTAQQARKLDATLGSLKGLPRDEKGAANARRFADKWLRNKLGIRGTGPHGHGLTSDQRKAITGALRSAFGIKAPERKAPAPRKAAAKGGKRGTRKSTAQLAKEQAARAAS